MAKGKGKKRQRVKPSKEDVVTTRMEKLQSIVNVLKDNETAYEEELNQRCREICGKIDRSYKAKLSAIPDNVKKMTVAEAIEYLEKQSVRSTECQEPLIIRSQYERCKASAQKRTLKKDRKRSLSASAAAKQLTSSRLLLTNRAISNESLLCTPAKFSRPSVNVVTPKFDPTKPFVSKIARKPKQGEVIMSLSGSPLHNYSMETTNGISLTLGSGKMIPLGDDVNEQEIAKEIDPLLKQTLRDLNKKIERILKS